MRQMLSKPQHNAMLAVMLQNIHRTTLILICLLFAGCAKTSVQITDDLWKTWQGMDELLQTNYPDAPPVILVHGWNGSEFTWPDVAVLQQFEANMHRDVYFFTYRTGIIAGRFPPIELLEEQLERYLLPFKEVDVIAHSMGGLLVRQYLSHHAEHPIRRLVFLSTPHFGTEVAGVLERVASISAEGNLQADEMQPGSDFLWQLNAQEGQELQGVEVLNAYIDGDSLLNSDLVVASHSAWLPWAANVSVATGNHHTLAAGLMNYKFILDFLSSGILPSLASMPARRDLWVRVRDQYGHSISLTSSALRRMDAQFQPRQRAVSICCERPSALHESARQTLLIEALQSDDVLWISRRNGRKPRLIKQAGNMLDYVRPVTLRELIWKVKD